MTQTKFVALRIANARCPKDIYGNTCYSRDIRQKCCCIEMLINVCNEYMDMQTIPTRTQIALLANEVKS